MDVVGDEGAVAGGGGGDAVYAEVVDAETQTRDGHLHTLGIDPHSP